MSLQGTIETFAVADVLRLLAATSKSGRLQVQGSSRTGTVWVDGGRILAAESHAGAGDVAVAETVFQLLRLDRGSFRFELDKYPPKPGDPVDIELALGDAESMLAEWRELSATVPSTDAWLTLRTEVAGPITLSPEQWRVVAAIGGGSTVAAVGDQLGLRELEAMRAAHGALEAGVAEVGTRPAAVPAVADVAAPPAVAAVLAADASLDADADADAGVVADVAAPEPAVAEVVAPDVAEPAGTPASAEAAAPEAPAVGGPAQESAAPDAPAAEATPPAEAAAPDIAALVEPAVIDAPPAPPVAEVPTAETPVPPAPPLPEPVVAAAERPSLPEPVLPEPAVLETPAGLDIPVAAIAEPPPPAPPALPEPEAPAAPAAVTPLLLPPPPPDLIVPPPPPQAPLLDAPSTGEARRKLDELSAAVTAPAPVEAAPPAPATPAAGSPVADAADTITNGATPASFAAPAPPPAPAALDDDVTVKSEAGLIGPPPAAPTSPPATAVGAPPPDAPGWATPLDQGNGFPAGDPFAYGQPYPAPSYEFPPPGFDYGDGYSTPTFEGAPEYTYPEGFDYGQPGEYAQPVFDYGQPVADYAPFAYPVEPTPVAEAPSWFGAPSGSPGEGTATYPVVEPVPAPSGPVPVAGAPAVAEAVPVVEAAPVAEAVPVVEAAPVAEAMPVVEAAPVEGVAPAPLAVPEAPVTKSLAPPPPPPPPSLFTVTKSAPAWGDDASPERIAPPPPPPPLGSEVGGPVASADAPAEASAKDEGMSAEEAANIERQLFNLSERAQAAVRRSSGLFDGKSRR